MTNKVIGHVSYEVHVDCPHCDTTLDLNEYPYNDELGMAVFGSVTEPANWDNLDIEFTCFNCHGNFTLSKLEV